MVSTLCRGKIARSQTGILRWWMGATAVGLSGILSLCCPVGRAYGQSLVDSPSDGGVRLEELTPAAADRVDTLPAVENTGWLAQTDLDEDSEGEDEEDEDDRQEPDIDQAFADNGLQQLLEALEAEPDLGPLPLNPVDEEVQAASPYRLFVDLEVRGTSNAGFRSFDRDRSSDAVFTPTLTFLALPSISDNAQLVASISGGSSIYASENDLAFGYLAASLGVNWDFAPFWFTRAEIQGQQVFAFENDDFQSLALQYQIGRSHVFNESSLYLRYFYQLRGSLTNDSDLDRIGNSLNASLLFPLNSRLQGRIIYRLLVDSFVNDARTDVNNRIRGEIRYAVNDIVSLRGFTTYTNNQSTDGDRDYDDVAVGVGLTANFPLGDGD